jgi:hypothetical protein
VVGILEEYKKDLDKELRMADEDDTGEITYK